MISFKDIILMNEEEYLDKENIIESYIINNQEDLIKWCSNNYCLYNPSVYGNKRLFNIGIELLLNSKKEYTNEDIKLFITYFATEALNDLNIPNININFSKHMLYSNYATSNYVKNKNTITFYLNKYEDLKKDNRNLLNYITIIFREIYKIKQNNELKSINEEFNLNDYLMILEIINSFNKDFYQNNYDLSIKENSANKYAFNQAIKYLKVFTPDLPIINNQELLTDVNNKYDSVINNITPRRIAYLEKNAKDIIENNLVFILDYPILAFGYELEGTPKSIDTLINDYKYYLEKYPEKKDNIDNLYIKLISSRANIDENEVINLINQKESKKNVKQLNL